MALILRKNILLLLVALSVAIPTITAQSRLDYYYLEAEKCKLQGDYSAAYALYQHCLDINPDSPEALHNKGRMLLFLRQDSLGLDCMLRASELDPGNPWYLEQIAAIYINRRQIDLAIPVLEKMSSLQTRRTDVLGQLMSYYKSMGRTQDAINVLDRMEMLDGKQPQFSTEKYSLYMDLEDSVSAFAQLEDLCREYPNDMNYRVLLASRYQHRGNMQKAHELLETVRQVDPHNSAMHMAMAEYYDQNGQDSLYRALRDSLLFDDNTDAETRLVLMRDYMGRASRDSAGYAAVCRTFDKVIGPSPVDVQMLTLYAAYLVYGNHPEDDIVAVMQRILAVEPDNQLAMGQLLQYYGKNERYEELEEICRRGVNYHPEVLGYHYYLGITLYQREKQQEAVNVLSNGLRTRNADEARPTLVSDMFEILGDLYYKLGNAHASFCAYDSSLVYNKDNISCLNNYAYYLSLRGEKLIKAEEMSYRTIKAEPDNRTYTDTYAWILFIQGRYSEAHHYMDLVVSPDSTETSLLQDPFTHSSILEHAGDIAWFCGEQDRALWLWQLALQRGDGDATAALPKKVKKKKYVKK